MGEVILTVGKLVFAGMGVAVGVRLGGKAREQGFFGLHSVALAAICVGGVGLLLMPAAQAAGSMGLMVAAEAAVRIGMLLLCVFVVGTFRRTPIAYAGAGACALFLIGAIVWDLGAQGSVATYDYAKPSSHANQASIAIPFLWATFESGIHWRRGRRRLALGLADPAVVRSYGIWTAITACFVGICALAIAAGVASAAGAEGAASVAQGLRGLLYLAVTGGVWMGLFQRAAHRGEASSIEA